MSASATPKVSSVFARPLARVLGARGLDAPGLLRELGAEDADHRVSFEAAVSVWRRCVEATGDELLGLATVAELKAGDYGVLEFAARACATLGEAFERLARFHRLLNDRAQVTLTAQSGSVRVEYMRPGVMATMPEAYLDYVLGSWVHLAAQLSAAPVVPRRAWLPRPRPSSPRAHQRLFGKHLAFDASTAALELEPEVLQRALPGADRRLLEALDSHAALRLTQLRTGQPVSAEVARVVEALLPDGAPRLAQVAERLGVPERALRRRLAAEETSFARVVDAVRQQLAMGLVQRRDLSLGEIAFLLGFSEPSAFHRAFKRWTGHTPRPLG